jgi:hypothetical protein
MRDKINKTKVSTGFRRPYKFFAEFPLNTFIGGENEEDSGYGL